MAKDIIDIYSAPSIVELLDDEFLQEIASDVIAKFNEDKESMAEMREFLSEAMEIAKQVRKEKTYPFEGASNVLYPLIATASMSFAARTYPEIIRNGKVVECVALGSDPTGEKEERAHRISQHMSAQLLVEDPEWESDTDRLLSCLSVVGTVFKKTYYDEYFQRNRSIMCTPDTIFVNKNIKSLETADRISHLIYMCANDVIARIRLGIFTDVSEELEGDENDPPENEDTDMLIEQHTFLDLDEDGYKEPYIVTVHKGLGKVLRIVPRFDLENVFTNAKGKIWRIDPVHYFTDFHFLRSPDGSYYGIGFGQLLLPINDTINTTINQLLDAGKASNMQSGLLGKGFKSKSGSMYLAPGEFKKVDVSGDDIRKNIFPMPVREPSAVLFQLLGVMIQTGKELSSVSEILQGQAPPQNSPATTVLALIEQGMKVFSSIQKRLHSSLKKEFGKLYRLNKLYLGDQIEYKQVLNSLIISKEDYSDKDLSVIPVSDPSMSSDAQRLARARALMEILPMVGSAGGQVILKNWLEALQTPQAQIEAILPPPDPNAAPSPEQIKMMMEQQKLQMEMASKQLETDLKAHELELKQLQTKINEADVMQRNAESQARIQKMYADAVLAQQQLAVDNENDKLKMSIEATNKIEAEAKKQAKDITNG